MSPRRRRSRAQKPVAPEVVVKRAMAAGQAAAQEALDVRARQQRRRARRPLPKVSPRREIREALAHELIPKATLDLLGPKPVSGVLVAEGDSWFDYPGKDVLGLLEDDYLFDVVSVAHAGDRVEDMAHVP